jgi:hypothetical protein
MVKAFRPRVKYAEKKVNEKRGGGGDYWVEGNIK